MACRRVQAHAGKPKAVWEDTVWEDTSGQALLGSTLQVVSFLDLYIYNIDVHEHLPGQRID